MPLVPEDFFEKDDAAKEEAREGVEEPKEGRELKIARRRLTAAMRNFTVADFTPDRWTFDHNAMYWCHSSICRLASYEKDLKGIADLRDVYVEALEDFIDLWVDSSEMSAWKEEILSTEKKVREHALAIRGQAVLLSRKLGINKQLGGKGEDRRDDNLNDLLSRYVEVLHHFCSDPHLSGTIVT